MRCHVCDFLPSHAQCNPSGLSSVSLATCPQSSFSISVVLAGQAGAPPTEGGGGVQLSCGQVGSGEVSALVVVVFHIERAQFGEVYAQRAAAVIDVLAVQRLKYRRTC